MRARGANISKLAIKHCVCRLSSLLVLFCCVLRAPSGRWLRSFGSSVPPSPSSSSFSFFLLFLLFLPFFFSPAFSLLSLMSSSSSFGPSSLLRSVLFLFSVSPSSPSPRTWRGPLNKLKNFQIGMKCGHVSRVHMRTRVYTRAGGAHSCVHTSIPVAHTLRALHAQDAASANSQHPLAGGQPRKRKRPVTCTAARRTAARRDLHHAAPPAQSVVSTPISQTAEAGSGQLQGRARSHRERV